MKRGEVWWVAFPEPIGRRPAVLVSRDTITSVPQNLVMDYRTPLPPVRFQVLEPAIKFALDLP